VVPATLKRVDPCPQIRRILLSHRHDATF
jgi:hypothetical protein